MKTFTILNDPPYGARLISVGLASSAIAAVITLVL